jgi:hypothetical protein
MGRNPSVGGFRRDKIKNWPGSFSRTTRKGYGKDTKARLEIFRKIKLQERFRMIKLQEDKAAAKEGKAQRPDYPPRTT